MLDAKPGRLVLLLVQPLVATLLSLRFLELYNVLQGKSRWDARKACPPSPTPMPISCLSFPPPNRRGNCNSSPAFDASDKGRVFHAAAGISEPCNGSVVTEPLELVLHGLRQHRAFDVRVLRGFRGELRVKVRGVKRVGLEDTEVG